MLFCKLNKPTSQSLNDITLTEKFQSQGLVINKTAKEESASVIDVEHATLPMNDMPDVSNRTNAQVDLNPSECTNSPTDEKAVENLTRKIQQYVLVKLRSLTLAKGRVE